MTRAQVIEHKRLEARIRKELGGMAPDVTCTSRDEYRNHASSKQHSTVATIGPEREVEVLVYIRLVAPSQLAAGRSQKD
jgi:hypothetical protein